MPSTEGKPNRMQNIELLRFVFSCVIVNFHLQDNISAFTNGSPVYARMKGASAMQYIIVEFFLVIAGLFLYRTAEQNTSTPPRTPFIVSFLDKFIRLWPVYFAYTIGYGLLHHYFSLSDLVLDLSFLRCTGISLRYTGIIWYIGPFFWGSIFVLGLRQVTDRNKAAMILALVAYWGYAIIINLSGGTLAARDVALEFVSLGFLRTIAGLSLGYLVGLFLDAFHNVFRSDSHASSAGTIVASLLEILLLVTIAICLFSRRLSALTEQPFALIALFIALLGVLTTQRGIFSRLCSRLQLGFCGKYAYSIYVMQQISFDILRQTLWNNEKLVLRHPYVTCLMSVCFSVIVGIAVYYTVELPSIRLYRKWKQSHICSGASFQSSLPQ